MTPSLTKFREAAETQEEQRWKGEHMASYGRREGKRAGKGWEVEWYVEMSALCTGGIKEGEGDPDPDRSERRESNSSVYPHLL